MNYRDSKLLLCWYLIERKLIPFLLIFFSLQGTSFGNHDVETRVSWLDILLFFGIAPRQLETLMYQSNILFWICKSNTLYIYIYESIFSYVHGILLVCVLFNVS